MIAQIKLNLMRTKKYILKNLQNLINRRYKCNVVTGVVSEHNLLLNKVDNSCNNFHTNSVKENNNSDLSNNILNYTNKTSSQSSFTHIQTNSKNQVNMNNQNTDSVQSVMSEVQSDSTTSKSIIREGLACILKDSKKVFYNPVQEFNRDLSVAAISVFADEYLRESRCQSKGKKRDHKSATVDDENHVSIDDRIVGEKYDDGIVILEALSATGLRSIRYAKEVAGVKEIIANDLSSAAAESIGKNIQYNNVEHLVVTSHSDASLLMYTRKAQDNVFDVIDLDPYGCPSRFLDASVQSVKDGGLLLVTCTDMAVLAGNSPETCYVKYGAVSLRNPACHEMALRITLQCIESHANRYGRYIVPQLSFSADFYIRVIVRVYSSPSKCKLTTSKLTMLYQCVGCQTFNYWPLGVAENAQNSVKFHLARGPPVSTCPHCCSHFYQGGPIWSGPLYNERFVEKMLLKCYDKKFATEKRMEGMLELIREELTSSILYYTIDSLCSKVHCEVVPRNKFVSALYHAGYAASESHAARNSVKTDAPSSVIWDIIRCWVKTHPVNAKRLTEGSIAKKLLSVEPKLLANFEIHPKVFAKKRNLLRYQQNPQPFWGPGTRDTTNTCSDNKRSKRHLNQNKKHKKAKIEKQNAEVNADVKSNNDKRSEATINTNTVEKSEVMISNENTVVCSADTIPQSADAGSSKDNDESCMVVTSVDQCNNVSTNSVDLNAVGSDSRKCKSSKDKKMEDSKDNDSFVDSTTDSNLGL